MDRTSLLFILLILFNIQTISIVDVENTFFEANSAPDYISIEPLINMSFVSGVVRLSVQTQKQRVDVYVNGSLYGSFGSVFTVEFDTTTWIDGIYIIDFITSENGARYSKRLIWFVDNQPPVAELKLPVITIGRRPWENGSIAPVMDPVLLNESGYVKRVGNSLYYMFYVKGLDRWIDRVTILINETPAEIYYRGVVGEGVFNSNITTIVYVKIPDSGLYYIKLEVRDLSGKINSSVLKVVFDLDKPLLMIEEPINETITNDTTIRFKMRPLDKTSRLCITSFFVTTSSTVKPNITNYIPIPGRFASPPNETLAFNITFNKSSKYYVWFLVLDEALNLYEDYIIVTIDNIPPEISYELDIIDNILNLKVLVNENLTEIDEVRIYINNSLIVTSKNPLVNISKALSPGYHIVEIEARDKAGNKASKTSLVYINTSTSSTSTSSTNAKESKSYVVVSIIAALTIAIITLVKLRQVIKKSVQSR